MKTQADAKQVTIFVNSTDQWHGRALYTAIVQTCEQIGIAGASVTRCAEGYGVHHHLHTARLLELSDDMPVRIDIVDAAERIAPLLAALDGMIREGLVIVSDVQTIRYSADAK
jgi:PII-like signaling protein